MAKGKRTEIDKKLLQKWYHDPGLTVAQVAEKVGVAPQNLIHVVRRYGIPTRKEIGLHVNIQQNRRPTLLENYAHISDDELKNYYYDKNYKVDEAAECLGMSGSTLVKLVRARGFKTRLELGITIRGYSKEEVEAALVGCSVKQAAQKLKTTDSVVYVLLKKWNIPKPKINHKRGVKKGQQFQICQMCNHLKWCKTNPHADQLPCELEATPYAPPPKANPFPTPNFNLPLNIFGGER